MPKTKNPAAVALGRKGGQKRAKQMTAAQRSEAARAAVLSRWKKTKTKTKKKKGKKT